MGMFDTFVFRCPNGCGREIRQQTKSFECLMKDITKGSILCDESGYKMDFTGYFKINHYTEPHTCPVCKKDVYALVRHGMVVDFCTQDAIDALKL